MTDCPGAIWRTSVAPVRRSASWPSVHSAAQQFAWRLIIAATPLGLAAIIIGAFMLTDAVGVGLIVGGVITVGVGYWGYWTYIENWARFISLLIALVLPVFLGHRNPWRHSARRRSGGPNS